MANNMKIKAKLKKGIVNVKVMATHDMLTYDQAKSKTAKAREKDANAEEIKANFITHISATCNGKVVYDVSTSQFWSKNPQFKFDFKGGAKGDKLEITWTDLLKNTVTESKDIK
jgi:sulfur-oxidizing protein SoxZ